MTMHLTRRLVRHRLDADANVFVNTLSGAIDVLTDEQIEVLDRAVDGHADGPESAALIDRLTRRGYLFHSGEEERQCERQLRETVRVAERAEQTLIAICPTYSCFFRCTYCYEGELTHAPHRPAATADEVAEGIEELRGWLARRLDDTGRPRLMFLGGEPLQEKLRKFIVGCLEAFATSPLKFKIITNGFLLNAFQSDLARHRSSVSTIQVTIDGPARVHDRRRALAAGDGTFERIAANIDAALDTGLPVTLRTNLDAQNIESLPELAKVIWERGWHELPGFRCYLAPTEDSTALGLQEVLREDQLLARWLPMKEDEELRELLSIFDDSSLFQVTAPLETALMGGERQVLPRFSFCSATKAKSFVFGPDGFIYQCLRGVGNPRTAVGRYVPSLDMDRDRVAEWLHRDVLNIDCPHCASVATLHGGGCALEVIHDQRSIGECSCGSGEEIVKNYLELRRDQILGACSGVGDLPARPRHIMNRVKGKEAVL